MYLTPHPRFGVRRVVIWLGICGYGFLVRKYPIFKNVSEFCSAVFKTNLNKMADWAVFRRVLIVAAHFTILEDAHMILVAEAVSSPKTDELVSVFPCDEVIPEAFLDEERGELACRTRGTEYAHEKILPPLMSHDADGRGYISYIGMERGIESPKPVLETIGDGHRISHSGLRQISNPLFFL